MEHTDKLFSIKSCRLFIQSEGWCSETFRLFKHLRIFFSFIKKQTPLLPLNVQKVYLYEQCLRFHIGYYSVIDFCVPLKEVLGRFLETCTLWSSNFGAFVLREINTNICIVTQHLYVAPLKRKGVTVEQYHTQRPWFLNRTPLMHLHLLYVFKVSLFY